MSLVLSEDTIGQGWEEVPMGDFTDGLTQYYNLTGKPRGWLPVPWTKKQNYICRLGNNYRRPVTFRAKCEAIWAAKWKILERRSVR